MKMIVVMMQLFNGAAMQPIGQWEGSYADLDCMSARDRIEQGIPRAWFRRASPWTYECVVMAIDGVQ